MTSRRLPLSNAEYLWRFFAWVLAALSSIALAVTFTWHYWYIVRDRGSSWCYYHGPGPDGGFDDPVQSVVTWWPLGVACTYTSGETYVLPGWGPTLVTIASVATLLVAIAVGVTQVISHAQAGTSSRVAPSP